MGGDSRVQERPLSAWEALLCARSLWRSGEAVFLRHARERMKERGISSVDVEFLILRSGRVVECSRPGPRSPWRYAIEGWDVDRRLLRIVVALERSLLVVTVMQAGR